MAWSGVGRSWEASPEHWPQIGVALASAVLFPKTLKSLLWDKSLSLLISWMCQAKLCTLHSHP